MWYQIVLARTFAVLRNSIYSCLETILRLSGVCFLSQAACRRGFEGKEIKEPFCQRGVADNLSSSQIISWRIAFHQSLCLFLNLLLLLLFILCLISASTLCRISWVSLHMFGILWKLSVSPSHSLDLRIVVKLSHSYCPNFYFVINGFYKILDLNNCGCV